MVITSSTTGITAALTPLLGSGVKVREVHEVVTPSTHGRRDRRALCQTVRIRYMKRACDAFLGACDAFFVVTRDPLDPAFQSPAPTTMPLFFKGSPIALNDKTTRYNGNYTEG